MNYLSKILILMGGLLFFTAHSQDYYFNRLDNMALAHGKIALDNEHYFVVGAVYNPSGSGALVLSKYSLEGEPILIDTVSSDGIITMHGHILLDDEYLFLYNVFNDIAPYNPVNNNLQLNKLSKDFNQIYSVSFGGDNTEYTSDIFLLRSDLYLLSSTYNIGSVDFQFVKFDLEGNMLWEKTYGSLLDERAISLVPTKDDNFLMVGQKNIEGENWDIYLIKTDTSGNVIWEKSFGGNLNDYGGRAIALHDHSFIIYHNINDGQGGPTTGYVEKRDGNGDLIWIKAFPYNDLSSFSNSCPIENSDGTLVVSNSVKNESGNMINRLIKLDPFGNTLWTKEYFMNPDWPQYINSIKCTDDGGYIMCGSARDTDLKQKAWIIKTNCNGEEGIQYPITSTMCEIYDCAQFPVDAEFNPSTYYINLASETGLVNFENNSANSTSRVWNFGDGTWDYSDSLVTHIFTNEGTYEVKLIVFHGTCSDTVTKTIEVVNTLGLEDLFLETEFTIYPNPANGEFKVHFKNGINGRMKIKDMLGRVYQAIDLNKSKLSYTISNLPKGVYILEVIMSNGRTELKRIEVI